MLKIAVCDDDKIMLDCVCERISEECRRQDAEIYVDKFSSGKDFLNANKTEPYDVVFLDIRMPDIGGFDVAAEIRKLSDKAYIIFITNENTLVYDSFNFQPFDFIPKTIPTEISGNNSSNFLENRIASVISRLLNRISSAKTLCLTLPYNKKISLNIADIQVVQSVRNYAEYIITGREPVRIRAKLDDIERGLDKHLFARTHKSFIINMNFIKDIDSHSMNVTLSDGKIIPISKTYKRDFETAYIDFLSSFGR